MYVEIAQEIALGAGALIRKLMKESLNVHSKGLRYDFVTNVDLQSQAYIQDELKKHFPGHLFIGEEQGKTDDDVSREIYSNPDEYYWIADPLDGTINFIRTLSSFSVSLGLFHNGETVAGVTYCPIENDLFVAEKGSGAFRNGKRMHVSEVSEMKQAFYTTGIPVVNLEWREEQCRHLQKLIQDTMNVRIIGTAARQMAMVADGKFDAYFEKGIHPWDVAVGNLLLDEAGGKYTRFDGSEYRIGNPDMFCSNGLVHEGFLPYLA